MERIVDYIINKDKLSDKIRSSKICGCHFTGNFFLIFIQFYITTNSIKFSRFSVLSPFQRFIPISAFYPHFSFRFRDSVSAFYPYPRLGLPNVA